MTITIAELESEVANRISALSATDFRTIGGRDAFRESQIPLTAVSDSEALAHLAFSVSVEQTPVQDDAQGAEYGAVDVMAEMVVVLVYKLGASTQVADYRLSSEAARRILSAIMQPYDRANFFPVQVFKPGAIRDGKMPVELRFRVAFELPI